MARVPLIACGKELTMEFEAMPLVPAQTVRVRFSDAGPLPPPKHFSDREDATMATIEEEMIRMMRESEKRQEELNTLYQEVERMRQANRPLNRREAVALAYVVDDWRRGAPLRGYETKAAFDYADLFCRIADETK